MSVDVEGLFAAFGDLVGKQALADKEFGETFRRMMQALVRFDHIVVFAYSGAERPIDLYSTFDRNEHVVFVALYQVGPYLLDPFYHTARERRAGVFRMRELAPDRFFSSEYYRTYYVKTGLAEEVGFFVTTGDGTTVVLSLMLHELATNAIKYGALSAAEGQVHLTWSIDDERFRLQWEEKGGPKPEPCTHRGFGSRLLSLGLGGQSRVEQRFTGDGLAFEMTAPVSDLAA